LVTVGVIVSPEVKEMEPEAPALYPPVEAITVGERFCACANITHAREENKVKILFIG
jgi:hypothetical protein